MSGNRCYVKGRALLVNKFMEGSAKEGMYCGNLHVTRELRTYGRKTIKLNEPVLILCDSPSDAMGPIAASHASGKVFILSPRNGEDRREFSNLVANWPRVEVLKNWKAVLRLCAQAKPTRGAGGTHFYALPGGQVIDCYSGSEIELPLEGLLVASSGRKDTVYANGIFAWKKVEKPPLKYVYRLASRERAKCQVDAGVTKSGEWYLRAWKGKLPAYWYESTRCLTPEELLGWSHQYCCGRPLDKDIALCRKCLSPRAGLVHTPSGFTIVSTTSGHAIRLTMIETPNLPVHHDLDVFHRGQYFRRLEPVPGILIDPSIYNRVINDPEEIFPFIKGQITAYGELIKFSSWEELLERNREYQYASKEED